MGNTISPNIIEDESQFSAIKLSPSTMNSVNSKFNLGKKIDNGSIKSFH